jgi:hypothetical protein
MGPPECLNRLQHTCTPRTDLRTHQSAAERKHRTRWATWGLADLGIGRTELGLANPGPPRGVRPISPRGRPRGGSLHLTPVLVPINRRGGGKNRTTHLKATSYLSLLSSFSFLLGGGETSSHQEYECEEDLA